MLAFVLNIIIFVFWYHFQLILSFFLNVKVFHLRFQFTFLANFNTLDFKQSGSIYFSFGFIDFGKIVVECCYYEHLKFVWKYWPVITFNFTLKLNLMFPYFFNVGDHQLFQVFNQIKMKSDLGLRWRIDKAFLEEKCLF